MTVSAAAGVGRGTNAPRRRSVLPRLRTLTPRVVACQDAALRTLALCIVAVQLAAVLAALLTRVMLHGDGASSSTR